MGNACAPSRERKRNIHIEINDETRRTGSPNTQLDSRHESGPLTPTTTILHAFRESKCGFVGLFNCRAITLNAHNIITN
mgnify:CR=1 FL=1